MLSHHLWCSVSPQWAHVAHRSPERRHSQPLLHLCHQQSRDGESASPAVTWLITGKSALRVHMAIAPETALSSGCCSGSEWPRTSFSFPQEHFKTEFTSGDGKKGKSSVPWDWQVYTRQWLTDGSPDWCSSPRLWAFLWIQLCGCSRRQPHAGPLQNPGRLTGGRNGPQSQHATQRQMEL